MSTEVILIETLDARGRVLTRDRFQMGSERRSISIGRSVLADVTLDDEHVAPLHAAISLDESGAPFVNDLGSRNGIITGGKRVNGSANHALPGGTFQVGRTRLRVRTAKEDLAPEKLDRQRHAPGFGDARWIASAGLLGILAEVFYTNWLSAPRDLMTPVVTQLLTVASLTAVWVAVWALLSRVMRGEWRWLPHVAVFFIASLMYSIATGLLDLAWFAFELPPMGMRDVWIAVAILGTAIWWHISYASAIPWSRAAVIASAFTIIIAASGYWFAVRPTTTNVNYIDSALRLYPPAFRLTAPAPLEALFEKAQQLEAEANRRVAQSLIENPDAEDELDAADAEDAGPN